jgi:hypothetical protein
VPSELVANENLYLRACYKRSRHQTAFSVVAMSVRACVQVQVLDAQATVAS